MITMSVVPPQHRPVPHSLTVRFRGEGTDPKSSSHTIRLFPKSSSTIFGQIGFHDQVAHQGSNRAQVVVVAVVVLGQPPSGSEDCHGFGHCGEVLCVCVPDPLEVWCQLGSFLGDGCAMTKTIAWTLRGGSHGDEKFECDGKTTITKTHGRTK